MRDIIGTMLFFWDLCVSACWSLSSNVICVLTSSHHCCCFQFLFHFSRSLIHFKPSYIVFVRFQNWFVCCASTSCTYLITHSLFRCVIRSVFRCTFNLYILASSRFESSRVSHIRHMSEVFDIRNSSSSTTQRSDTCRIGVYYGVVADDLCLKKLSWRATAMSKQKSTTYINSA